MGGSALRVVDKMPENTLYLGWIATLFPRATVIHCRRDLRDVAVSCWMTHLAQVRWACDPDHIASRINDHLRLMDHWHQVLPIPMLEIDYESMVADPESEARKAGGLVWPRLGPGVPELPREPPPRPDGKRRPGSPAGPFPLGRPLEELRRVARVAAFARSSKSRGHEPPAADHVAPLGGRGFSWIRPTRPAATGCRFGPQEPGSGSKTPAHGVWQPGHVP